MPDLFSQQWADKYKEIWNSSEGIAEDLAKIGFNSVVGFGIEGEDSPRCVLTITDGQVIHIGDHKGEVIKWDLRASEEYWSHLLEKPPGLMKLGLAYTSRKLKFHKGDYAVMVKDPSLSSAFVKSFALMNKALH